MFSISSPFRKPKRYLEGPAARRRFDEILGEKSHLPHRGNEGKGGLNEEILCQFFDFQMKWWGCVHCYEFVFCEAPANFQPLLEHLQKQHSFEVLDVVTWDNGNKTTTPKLAGTEGFFNHYKPQGNDGFPAWYFDELAEKVADEAVESGSKNKKTREKKIQASQTSPMTSRSIVAANGLDSGKEKRNCIWCASCSDLQLFMAKLGSEKEKLAESEGERELQLSPSEIEKRDHQAAMQSLLGKNWLSPHRALAEKGNLKKTALAMFFDFGGKIFGCRMCFALVDCDWPAEGKNLFRHLRRDHGFKIRNSVGEKGTSRCLREDGGCYLKTIPPKTQDWPTEHFARLATALFDEAFVDECERDSDGDEDDCGKVDEEN